MRLTELQFASLLSYAPYGKSDEHLRSKEIRTFIKNDTFVDDPRNANASVPMSEWISIFMESKRASLPFIDFFQGDVVLVPTPGSSLRQANSLWVPERLSNELIKRGFGFKVVPCIARIKAVPKSAYSPGPLRPKVTTHFESLAVQSNLVAPERLLLVDDIITRGATFLACANRLRETFPEAQIRGFAAMRTMTDPLDFQSIYSPCVGNIYYRPIQDDTLRRP